MVENDGRSAPLRRNVYSMSACSSNSFIPGLMDGITSRCARTVMSTALRIIVSSAAVFVPRSCSTTSFTTESLSAGCFRLRRSKSCSSAVRATGAFSSSGGPLTSPTTLNGRPAAASESSAFVSSPKVRPRIPVSVPTPSTPTRVPVHTSRLGCFGRTNIVAERTAPFCLIITSAASGSLKPVR